MSWTSLLQFSSFLDVAFHSRIRSSHGTDQRLDRQPTAIII